MSWGVFFADVISCLVTCRPSHIAAAAVVDEEGGGAGEDVVGVEAVDGEVVGDHHGVVGAQTGDGHQLGVAGLETVAGVEVVGWGPGAGGGVPVQVVAGAGDRCRPGGGGTANQPQTGTDCPGDNDAAAASYRRDATSVLGADRPAVCLVPPDV